MHHASERTDTDIEWLIAGVAEAIPLGRWWTARVAVSVAVKPRQSIPRNNSVRQRQGGRALEKTVPTGPGVARVHIAGAATAIDPSTLTAWPFGPGGGAHLRE